MYKLKIILLLTSAFLCCQNVFSQNEPNRIELTNQGLLDVVMNKTFENKELKNVKKGIIMVKCFLDSSGNVYSTIISYQKGYKISNTKKKILLLNIRKYLKYKIPIEYKKISKNLLYVNVALVLKSQ
ncbi:MAG: hypothetical protein NTU43_02405 [Bacteroidetes bacterium]|nr:hypothetical protein [Bacteroidota bacterium]